MNDLLKWFLDNNAFVFEIKTQLFSQRQAGVNKHYEVFTIPTQHFYIDSLEELTVDRLNEEKARQERFWVEDLAIIKRRSEK